MRRAGLLGRRSPREAAEGENSCRSLGEASALSTGSAQDHEATRDGPSTGSAARLSGRRLTRLLRRSGSGTLPSPLSPSAPAQPVCAEPAQPGAPARVYASPRSLRSLRGVLALARSPSSPLSPSAGSPAGSPVSPTGICISEPASPQPVRRPGPLTPPEQLQRLLLAGTDGRAGRLAAAADPEHSQSLGWGSDDVAPWPEIGSPDSRQAGASPVGGAAGGDDGGEVGGGDGSAGANTSGLGVTTKWLGAKTKLVGANTRAPALLLPGLELIGYFGEQFELGQAPIGTGRSAT
eukprot:scaffold5689_cov73-Isochrysis_galbana.AAC.1